jgi:hypothetical protein
MMLTTGKSRTNTIDVRSEQEGIDTMMYLRDVAKTEWGRHELRREGGVA